MGWRARSLALLALLAGCSARSPSPSASRGSQAQGTGAAARVSGAQGAAELPCPRLEARHARALAEADLRCRSDRDCICVARPPFLDAKVVVARSAAPELEAIATAFRNAGCPPVTLAQASGSCKPVCRKGRCAKP